MMEKAVRGLSIVIAFALLSCCLSGCLTIPDAVSDLPQESLEAPSKPEGPADDPAESELTSQDCSDILNKYLERYQTERYWRDMSIDFKFFLLSDSELVCLLAVRGAEQVTAVPLSSIANIRRTEIGGSTVVVEVSDKSGGTVSVMLSLADAEDFLKELNE